MVHICRIVHVMTKPLSLETAGAEIMYLIGLLTEPLSHLTLC